MTKIAQYLSIQCIIFYQKFISPRKGFCCAHRQHNGGRSCSHFALTVIRRHGISALWLSFPKRLEDCKISSIALNKKEDKRKRHNCTDSCNPVDCVDIFKMGKGCHGNCFDISLSLFFPLQWLYKISLKRRNKKK